MDGGMKKYYYKAMLVGLIGVALAALVWFGGSFNATGVGPVFFVSTTGNDANSGTIDAPLRTIEKARDSVRAAGLPGSKIIVRSGEYNVNSSLIFTAQDSGSADAPNMVTNYPGERPVITGSFPVKDLTLKSGRTYETNLTGTPAENAIFDFVYHGDTRLVPARYPNWAPPTKKAIDPYAGRFMYVATDQPAVKNVIKYRAEDSAVISQLVGDGGLKVSIYDKSGLWRWLENRDVTSIDTDSREITLATALPNNVAVGELFWIQGSGDLLSEGEFHFDKTTKKLTVNLDKDFAVDDVIYVPIVNEVVLMGASNFVWQGFKIEKFQSRAFHVNTAVENVTFQGNEVRWGGNAFTTEYQPSTKLRVLDNYLHDLDAPSASSAIAINGGNFMKSLTPTNNVIKNNLIENIDLYAGRGRTAVWLDKEQVGILVEGNTVRDVAGHGVIVSGNDHIIRKNTIYNSGWLHRDTGLINLGGRSVLQSGHLIEENYLHSPQLYFERSYGSWELVTKDSTVAAFTPFMGIMADDWVSGLTIQNNVIENPVGTCISNHGGMYNHYINNYLVCREAVFFDEPITTTGFFEPLYDQMYQQVQSMASQGYNAALYNQKYPHISELKADPAEGETMIKNEFKKNIIAPKTTNGGTVRLYKFHRGGNQVFANNLIKYLPGQTFKVTYEAPDPNSSTYSDVDLATWQGFGYDTDITQVGATDSVFEAEGYKFSPSSAAPSAGITQIDPSLAGVRTIKATAPAVLAGTTTITNPEISITVTPNTNYFSYQVASVQYQLRSVSNTGSQTAVGAWVDTQVLNPNITITSPVNNSQYVVCVHTSLDSLNLESLPVESLWGQEGCTNPVTYTVSSGGGSGDSQTDQIPPTLTINLPIVNAIYSGNTIKVSSEVTDNVGVSRVDYYVDGSRFGGCGYSTAINGGTCAVNMNTKSLKIANGNHVLKASARDVAGNTIEKQLTFTFQKNTGSGGTGGQGGNQGNGQNVKLGGSVVSSVTDLIIRNTPNEETAAEQKKIDLGVRVAILVSLLTITGISLWLILRRKPEVLP